MNLLADRLITIGSLGLLLSTIGSVIPVWLLSKFMSRKSVSKSNVTHRQARPLKIDLLVAAHNEEAYIVRTLTSLVLSSEKLKEKYGANVEVNITIGLDHCTDLTEATTRGWAHRHNKSLNIIRNPKVPGKWQMLQALISRSQADWVALIDVGSVWDSELLLNAMPNFTDRKVIGVAPSYQPVRAGKVDSYTWKLEAFLKSLESDAGGPVSVHGATVLYRRKPLLKILKRLDPIRWINDDVAIPMMLKIRYPRMRIVYLSKTNRDSWVKDYGVTQSSSTEYRRRRRILLGNLQWIKMLYRKALFSNFSVSLIATRRVFRTFWTYWLSFIAVGIAIYTYELVNLPFLIFMIFSILFAVTGSAAIRKLCIAFFIGLQIPIHWMDVKNISEETWN